MRLLLLAVAFSAMTTVGCSDESLEVAQDVDLSRFQGKWYEVAKLPRATQTDCHGTTAFYKPGDGADLVMESSCHVGSLTGPVRAVSANAKVTDPAVPAKLSVDFGGFFGDYWIIDVGDHYEYAVVGHPTRQYLWILSRTTKLADDVLNGILERARAKKFDTGRLEYTEQP